MMKHTTRKGAKFFALLIIILFICFSSSAQVKIDSTGFPKKEPDSIGQVIITGQYRPQPVDRSIYPVRVIGTNDIQTRAAGNLGELLRTEPGFQVNSADIWGDFIRIRGLTGENIKILIDGLPVTGRVGDRLELGQLSLHRIKQVEIVEGPLSVIYGSNALAGAINLISNDYAGVRFQGALHLFYETAGTYNGNFRLAKKVRNHFFDINAGRNFFKGWSPEGYNRYKVYKPRLQYFWGGGYQYAHHHFKLALLTDYMHEEIRDPGELSLANLYEKALDNYQYTTRWNNRLNMVHTFRNNLLMNLQAGYSVYRKRRLTYLNDLVNLEKHLAADPDLHDTTGFKSISARGSLSNATNRKIDYQTGIDFNYESATGRKLGGFRETTDLAAFMSFMYKFSDLLQFQPGVRIIYNSDFAAPVIYGINIKWSPGKFIFRGNHASAFKAPSLKQLYLSFIDSNHEIHGNEDLKPETAYNTELSAAFHSGKDNHAAVVSFTLYHISIKNAIQLAISTERPGWGKYFNVENSRYISKGLELKLSYRHSPGLNVNTGLQLNGISRYEKQNDFNWSTDLYAMLSLQIRKPAIQTSFNYKWIGDYMEFAGNYDATGNLRSVAQQRISGYHLMDVTLTKKFMHNNLNLTAGIKNILNVTTVRSEGNLNLHGNMNDMAMRGYGRTFVLQVQYILTNNT